MQFRKLPMHEPVSAARKTQYAVMNGVRYSMLAPFHFAAGMGRQPTDPALPQVIIDVLCIAYVSARIS